jgi:hypothetical protein
LSGSDSKAPGSAGGYLLEPGQTLAGLTAHILAAIEPVMETEHPDLVVVQGDTTTTLAGAVGAFYQQIAVAHVEAGLRTGDMMQPFPEEMNRVLTSRIATWHFAPTARAEAALLGEGVARERIFVTGNTGIDAVLYVRDALDRGALRAPEWPWMDSGKRLVLVTSHRRENFGPGFDRVMRALSLVASRPDVQIVYPASSVVWPFPTPKLADALAGVVWDRDSQPSGVLPRPVPSLSIQPSPFLRRVGIHIFTFEACSSFTRVTACKVAHPPFVGFIARLRPSRFPDSDARKLSSPTNNYLSGPFPHW